jgi:hypothetical protein
MEVPVLVAEARRAGMVAVVLAALTMGLAFAHTLELPQKLDYDAATWTQIQHTLYRYFAVIGGPLEWRPSLPPWCSRCGLVGCAAAGWPRSARSALWLPWGGGLRW